MKKTVIVLALTLAALAAFGVGVAFAQDPQPPYYNGGMMGGGETLLHAYMVTELAKELNLSADVLNARLNAGESMYAIALAEGVKAEDFPALMTKVRANAVAAAVKAGALTQQQADWMNQRGAGMMDGSYCSGTCDGTQQGARGQGRGGMMGGRWQQVTP